MKINNFSIYKTDIVAFMVSGLFAIIGSVILTVRFYAGEGVGDFIILFFNSSPGNCNCIIANYYELQATDAGSFNTKRMCFLFVFKKTALSC